MSSIRNASGVRKRPLPNETDNQQAIMRAVRGPTSALTDFLAQEGIRVNRGNIQNEHQQVEEEQMEEVEQAEREEREVQVEHEQLPEVQPQVQAAVASTSRNVQNEIDEDAIDGEEGVENAETREGVVEADGARSKKTMAAQKAAARRLFEKEQADAEYSERLDQARSRAEAADAKRALDAAERAGVTEAVEDMQRISQAIPSAPAVGKMANCAECTSRFCITKYTQSDADGGVYCHRCKQVEESKPKVKAKKATASQPARGKALGGFNKLEGKVSSLADMCILLLAKHIQDIEGSVSGEEAIINARRRDQLCKIVAKNRRLDGEIAKIFYHVSLQDLELYDATKIDALALGQIATFCPHLISLNIHLCGLADSETMRAWGTLKQLQHLELYGPFLVRRDGWQDFLERRAAHLKSFKITQSPRFDKDNLQTLVKTVNDNPDFSALRLSQIGLIEDSWLPCLYPLTNLTDLDLSDPPSCSLTTPQLIDLLSHVGKNLLSLNLNNNYAIEDSLLTHGIKPFCPNLERLSLVNCVELDPAGFIDLFGSGTWTSKGLIHLNIERCFALDDLALAAILSHSRHTLRSLSLHSLRFLTAKAIAGLATAKQLLNLDLGFVRVVDDHALKTVIDGCHGLREISLFGCNRLSKFVPRKPGLILKGVEALTS